ncbi:rod shape-determining protein MreD [Aliidiomarina quisquiliarum]|uniref:rod shape-determining protein MreD n=1 Tax=Aliidiomarina quisquiliarum TaxID=2938947 RepID=UPI00208F5A4A|nr:rod shape-determining protein MreD [Aliidiomarina quisquiliarum]MCO4321413.1 rod shape-determining protein MreD [Aliidiomarina quisquiliarum]
MMIEHSSWTQRGLILATFVLGLVLALMPMSLGLAAWRPDWQILVLFYWLMAFPHRVSIGTAFILGIAVDVLLGTTFGIHAAAYSLVAYPVARHYQRIRHFSLLQQAALMGFLVAAERTLAFTVEHYLNNATLLSSYYWPVLSSALVWPWLYLLLRKIRRRFHLV